jgi:hypothetical protein
MNRTTALNTIKELIEGMGWLEVEILSPDDLERYDISSLRMPFWVITWTETSHLPEHPEVIELTVLVHVYNERFGHPRGQDTYLAVTGLVEQVVTELNLLGRNVLNIIGYISATSAPRNVTAGEKTLQRATITFQITTWEDE